MDWSDHITYDTRCSSAGSRPQQSKSPSACGATRHLRYHRRNRTMMPIESGLVGEGRTVVLTGRLSVQPVSPHVSSPSAIPSKHNSTSPLHQPPRELGRLMRCRTIMISEILEVWYSQSLSSQNSNSIGVTPITDQVHNPMRMDAVRYRCVSMPTNFTRTFEPNRYVSESLTPTVMFRMYHDVSIDIYIAYHER